MNLPHIEEEEQELGGNNERKEAILINQHNLLKGGFDSKLYFYFCGGSYTFKIFHKGKAKEVRHLDYTQFFHLIKEKCNLDLEAIDIPTKK